jgi:pimeloyl-ACP methyl ester carboxylesterase
VIERSGHCPQIEQPDTVNALLLEFLAEAPAVAGNYN